MNYSGGYYYDKFPNLTKNKISNQNNTINKFYFYSELLANKNNLSNYFDSLYQYYNPIYGNWLKEFTIIDHNNVIIHRDNNKKIIQYTERLDIIEINKNDKDISQDISYLEFISNIINFVMKGFNGTRYISVRRIAEAFYLDRMDYLSYIKKFRSNSIVYITGKFFNNLGEITNNTNSISLSYDTGLIWKVFDLITSNKINIISEISQNEIDLILRKYKNINIQNHEDNIHQRLMDNVSNLSTNTNYKKCIHEIIMNFTDDEYWRIINAMSFDIIHKKFEKIKLNNYKLFISNFIKNVMTENNILHDIIIEYQYLLDNNSSKLENMFSFFIKKYGLLESNKSIISQRIRTIKNYYYHHQVSINDDAIAVKLLLNFIIIDAKNILFGDNIAYNECINDIFDWIVKRQDNSYKFYD